MKSKTLLIIIMIVAALALIKIFYLSPKKAGAPQGGAKQAPAVPVTVVIVKSAEVENKISVSGSILANEEAMLKPEMAGKIISLQVKEGTQVQKGQLIAKINDATLQAQLRKAQVQQSLATDKEQRLKQLLGIKGVSQDEYDVALSTLNASNADIDLLKAQIMETEVRAPFDGVIGLRNISEGNYISTADVIASIQQLDPIKIDFSVPEKYTAMVQVNDTVYITLEGTKKQYKAKVYAIDPKIDANTRSLRVRAICNNQKHEILPGSYAQVDLILKSENSVIVPSTAVIPDLRGQKTYLVRNGKAELIPIETGSRTDTKVEVTKGLKPGDTLVTGGIMALKPGAAVKIQGLKKEK